MPFRNFRPRRRSSWSRWFFAYADQKASDALDNHLGLAFWPWTSELVSAWSRFIIVIHLRHPDVMPKLRSAAARIWEASGIDCQARWIRRSVVRVHPAVPEISNT
jgi:hypothetical protein